MSPLPNSQVNKATQPLGDYKDYKTKSCVSSYFSAALINTLTKATSVYLAHSSKLQLVMMGKSQ